MDLTGKRALVTGGAVRIGKAIVQALQAAGAEVVVHFRRSGAELGLELAAQLRMLHQLAHRLRRRQREASLVAGLLLIAHPRQLGGALPFAQRAAQNALPAARHRTRGKQ